MSRGKSRIENPSETICDHVGHEWDEAGGGLLICANCEAEKWAEGVERCPGCMNCEPGPCPVSREEYDHA